MAMETWVAYALACALLSIIPGPSVLLVTGQALLKGFRLALVCILGELSGGSCLMLLSLLGLGTLLTTSAALFIFVKGAGVAYLAYLGIRQIIEARRPDAPDGGACASPSTNRGSFGAGFTTALLNPKSVVFYMAFLSQFLDPLGNQALQCAILICTSVFVAGVVLAGYALLAARARQALTAPGVQRVVKYSSGTLYLGGSAMLGTTR